MRKVNLKTLVSTADQCIDRVEVYSIVDGVKHYEYGFQLIGKKPNHEKAEFINSKLDFDYWNLYSTDELVVLEVLCNS